MSFSRHRSGKYLIKPILVTRKNLEFLVFVEYDNCPTFCHKCSLVGHGFSACHHKKVEERRPLEQGTHNQVNETARRQRPINNEDSSQEDESRTQKNSRENHTEDTCNRTAQEILEETTWKLIEEVYKQVIQSKTVKAKEETISKGGKSNMADQE